MLPTDRDVTLLADPVCTLYQQLEYDIIVEIAKRFATYDAATGQLEWLLQRLQHFQEINPALVKLFAKYSGKSEQEIRRMLEQAQRLNIDLDTLQGAYGDGNIGVDPGVVMNSPVLRDILESSHKELDATFRLIQTKAMESAQQTYMNILNTAYIETASGAYSMQESVKRGLQRAARKGITAATYKHTNPDGTVRYVNYSIEGVVRRDTRSAINKLANASSYKFAEELGAEYVEVSSHLGARVHPTNPIANHAGWQGGVYKINGSAPGYPNLKDSTGYPDDILGLAGVNCRHRIFPFFPGISVRNPIHYGDTEENRHRYEAEQKQRQYERQIRALKKERAAMQIIGDQDAVATLTAKLRNRQSELQAHCDKYGLRRDYSRELVQEDFAGRKYSAKANREKNAVKTKNDDVYGVGDIDIEVYSNVTSDIVTNRVIVTGERINHIKEHHPNDYEQYEKYLRQTVIDPDYIIHTDKPNTAVALKSLDDKYFKTIVRLATSNDKKGNKNSVITFMKIREKEYDRLLRNKKILYNRE